MPESDRTVKCPICDEDFDPTVAGGWCTNPDCGEWQHTGETATDFDADEEAPSDADLIAEGTDDAIPPESGSSTATTADEATNDDDGDEEPTVADEISSDTDDADVTKETADTASEATPEDDAENRNRAEPDVGTDSDGTAENGGDSDTAGTSEAANEEASGADDAHESADLSDEESVTDDEEPTTDDEATIACPDCERELDADANFCMNCGADVQDITPGDEGSLDACPACDTAVDDDASFCANCGENLDAHRGASDESTADSASDSATTGETTTETTTGGNAVETLASQTTDDEPVPDTLVLSVEGRDIAVEDGDRIGREIRAALLDAGRPEDEAVRIHREHVRFDRQPEGFYLVDLGDNPTRLNGTPMQKGDREPVQPGDELELSGVVTMTIRAA